MAFCLSFHAAYRCRHSGECCRAGWPIPFDHEEVARVESLRLADAPFVHAGGRRLAAIATRHPEGHCIFFEPDRKLCAIHRSGGAGALPITCRMFPRIVLKDGRGTFLTLSHYCPTAAALLLEPGPPTTIVEAPASLIPAGVVDGLDASDTWPPLLRPDVLMDHASYALWERHAIASLAGPDLAPSQALDAIEAATTALNAWSPGGTALCDAVTRAFGRNETETADWEPDFSLVALVLRAVPVDLLRGTAFSDRPSVAFTAHIAAPYAAAINRWLAARLFATWISYQANGLRAIVRYLRACLSVLLVELCRDWERRSDERRFLDAVRRSDHLIVHLADSQRLATLMSRGSGSGVRDPGLGMRD